MLWYFLSSVFYIVSLGTDNLAANFSRELADYIIYIIDVSGGDKIPRKGGPGITQADLLVHTFIVSMFTSDRYLAGWIRRIDYWF